MGTLSSLDSCSNFNKFCIIFSSFSSISFRFKSIVIKLFLNFLVLSFWVPFAKTPALLSGSVSHFCLKLEAFSAFEIYRRCVCFFSS